MCPDSTDAATYDAWAPYYDLMDADREPFIDFYASMLTDQTRSLLEIGCGTGTITIALGRKILERHGSDATRVVGVDESHGMLDVARERFGEGAWIPGDMRSPPVEGPFDLVMCCFSTLQCLLRDADLAEAFTAARNLCGEGGTFAFDVYQPNLEYLRTPRSEALARVAVDADGRRLEIRESTSYDEDARILLIDWRLVDAGHPDVPLATMHQPVRQYFPADIERLVERAGLAIRERYGDLDRSPFTAESKKQVLVCRPA